MKKNTEIALITTGITLAALWWVLLDDDEDQAGVSKTDTTKKKDDVSSEEKEDAMIAELIHSDQYDSFVKVNRLYTRRLPKRTFKGLHRSATKLGNEAFYKRLQDRYETTQLTITNTSDVEREVRLWAGNKKPPLSPTLPGDVADHIFRTVTVNSNLGTGIYPQGIIVNPFNGFTYIANQLSHNISVLNTEGVIVSLIPITANASSPFGVSPVDLTVNSQPSSPNFGTVYVANIIGDTVTVINTQLEIVNTIQVGKRPISITFNPFNSNVYIANIADDTISVIDTTTETVIETIGVGKAPRNIAIVPKTGSVYVVNSNDNSISVIDTNNQVTNTIDTAGSELTTIAYHPVNNSLYIVSSGDNTVIPIDLDTNTTRASIPVGADPYRILYNPSNELLYVGNRGDNSYSIVDTTDVVIDTLFLGAVGTGVAIDPNSDMIYSSDSTNGAINIISYSRESNKVLINDGYKARREDFTFNPAIVKHVKFVLSGTERFKVLKLEEETVTGKTNIKPISFSSYNSPQNFGNVAEVFEMNGAIIDGKNGWVFKIAGKQTITILTYYKQYETENILEDAILN
ncbi:YncE family protein [Aquimarina algiphila]|uniref:YncE family protein n=1 Tax=Aquimarina algiphila TaxID=2047982 RepID=A0A554VJ96_9FLAO|nr:YncE family protein [Aquimarina algiphila]TSE07916.1 YncE family protein [Aquimarina algiphila]